MVKNKDRIPGRHKHYHHHQAPLTLIVVVVLICSFQNVICQNINNNNNNNNNNINNNDYYEEMINSAMANGGDELLINSPINQALGSHTKLVSLDVICGKEYMTVRAEFNGQFNGIIFSKGTYGQSKCVYVKPHSGLTHVTFNVRYDECGTKPDLQGRYFENTIVIQYGTDIIEAYDEAKRLRCEWFEAYEKPATFRPAIPVADLDIIEMNFQGDEIDCWMSIQEGKGPWSNEINRIVTVGQPLTIVVAINDKKNQFDMKVKSCFAHDGHKSPIYLIDEDGCILRPKMISPFQKLRNLQGKASLISYAQFLAFKFPDSVDVQIQCTVEVCRHGCVDTCGSNDIGGSSTNRLQQPQLHRDSQIESRIQITKNVSNNYQQAPLSKQQQPLKYTKDVQDLLELADSNGNMAIKPPDEVSVDVNLPQPATSYGALAANDDDNNNGDGDYNDGLRPGPGDEKQNYLDLIADYLHNFDAMGNKLPTSPEDSSDSLSLLSNVDYRSSPPPSSSPPSAVSVNIPNDHPTMQNIESPPTHHLVMIKQQQLPPPQPAKQPNYPPIVPHVLPPLMRPINKNIQHGEPVAQILNIPLNPIYSVPMPLKMAKPSTIIANKPPLKSNGLSSLLNGLKLFQNNNKKLNLIGSGGSGGYLPQVLSSYFNSNPKRNQNHHSHNHPQQSSLYMPNDNFDFSKLVLPPGTIGTTGLYKRSKRYINDKQGEIGLKKGFQVVTALDLSFTPNMMSQDQALPVFEGKPETIVYGICFSSISFVYAISTATIILLGSITISIIIVVKLEKLKKSQSNKC